MNCYYCDQIAANDPTYAVSPASHDLGSAAPRCPRHWRYTCGQCGATAHFMCVSYCEDEAQFFCSSCADGQEEVPEPFWAWKYYFRYRSPWSRKWVPAMDRLEYEGRHPLLCVDTRRAVRAAISKETYLARYPERPVQWSTDHAFTDAQVRANWNANAELLDARYDDDGDRNRRYQSDEPMLTFLGDVQGRAVLDAGSGNGYLSRKLARAGAAVTGVELSDQLLRIAEGREAKEKLGITYRCGPVSDMCFLPNAYFDKAVANYVLMDVRDYRTALKEVFRVLRPGGCFVAVSSHPCFASGPAGWVTPAPDSPRPEDRYAWQVDRYFHRGPFFGQWGGLKPVLSFHRTLGDYWRAFAEAGFVVDDFEEPSITDRGRREMPSSVVEQCLRVPWSCIFRLVKPPAP